MFQDIRPAENPRETQFVSRDAEQGLIGGLLLDNDQFDVVSSIIQQGQLGFPDHRLIYGAIRDVIDAGQVADAVTVHEYLDASGDSHRAGGLGYLANLAANTPSAANCVNYAKLVSERYSRRALLRTLHGMKEKVAGKTATKSSEFIMEAEALLAEVAKGCATDADRFSDMQALLKEGCAILESRFSNGNEYCGHSSGLESVDTVLSGFRPGALYILAARPGMGKTALALNMSLGVARSTDKPVLFFSMEMPQDQITMRLISSEGRVLGGRLDSGKLDEHDWPRVSAAVQKLNDTKLIVNDDASNTPTQLRAKCRMAQSEHGELGMVVIDYLQLMTTRPGESRVAEVTEISRALKKLAKELNCPVIALSQLNRNLENRVNKRPVNADLRDSGSIEQDADVVMMLYRDEVYNEDTYDRGLAELNVTKNRAGALGSVKLRFEGEYTRFSEWVFR